jgi:hypothetical protein
LCIGLSSPQCRQLVRARWCSKRAVVAAVIDQYRRSPTSTDLGPTVRETSIVAAPHTQLATKDNEIRTLKAKVYEQESTIGCADRPR